MQSGRGVASGSHHSAETSPTTPSRCLLTSELSGRPPPPLRIGEHAIHCEHDAPTMIHGPFQRIARGLIYKSSPYQGNALHAIHANATQCSFTDFSGVSPLR